MALAGLVYAGDYVSLRFRIPGNREQFGSVTVQPYYAIAEKNNKTQFISADPQTVTCVHALFPHFTCQPCWWVSRHTDQRIDE
jgi:hypothetical protein